MPALISLAGMNRLGASLSGHQSVPCLLVLSVLWCNVVPVGWSKCCASQAAPSSGCLTQLLSVARTTARCQPPKADFGATCSAPSVYLAVGLFLLIPPCCIRGKPGGIPSRIQIRGPSRRPYPCLLNPAEKQSGGLPTLHRPKCHL